MNRILGSLSKKAMVAALAGAMTVTAATTQPVRAGDDEAAGAIVAATVFGLMAAAIIASKHKDKNRRPPPAVTPVAPTGPGPLPAECRFEVTNGYDRGSWYGRECLVASYRDWPKLPDRCERWVELPRWRQEVTAYNAQCLAQFGFW